MASKEFVFNLLRYAEKKLLPFRVSKERKASLTLDLLLLTDGHMHHYVLIKDLFSLVQKVRSKHKRSRSHLCRNCFHVSSSADAHNRHLNVCLEHRPAVVKMPNEDQKDIKFKNIPACWYAPVVGFFDMESIIEPVATCADDPSKPSSHPIEVHSPCSNAMLFVEHDSVDPVYFKINWGPDCMDRFIQNLEEVAKLLHEKKRQHPVFTGTIPADKQDASNCWLCGDEFGDTLEQTEKKVLDHCHMTGKFLGWAHSRCNISRKNLPYTPVFAHNLSNYDMHHVMKALCKTDSKNLISIVPSTSEKFIALELAFFIKTVKRKDGRCNNIYERIRLLDSFKFMNSSLEKLASTLPKNEFHLTDKHFEAWPGDSVTLLKQKGHFPYAYIDNFEKLEEPRLPKREQWTNSLTRNSCSVTVDEWYYAEVVFDTFGCRNIRDYYNLYLVTDVFILADVMNSFRKTCFETYGLDCCQYYTASNLAGDAMIKICKPDLELLVDREHLDMVENLMRGGLSSVFSKRFVAANNPSIPETYDPRKPRTWIVMMDANNLYGGIMEKFFLPLGNYVLVEIGEAGDAERETLNMVLNTSEDSPVGYILEVDLEYPMELHDLHKDFPLAPTKETVAPEWLSDYQINMLDQLKASRPSPKVKKLVQTMFKKENYTLHYRTLQLYVELGLKVCKVHRILRFTQAEWLSEYVKLNTRKRRQAETKIRQDFHKLMNNSAFGKTCESKHNRIKIKVARNEDDLMKWTSDPAFKSFSLIAEDFATVSLDLKEIKWDKPTIVGACILDLAKAFMFHFHYNVMKPNFDCSLLYSDTDSFIYEIRGCDDFYETLAEKPNVLKEFDFSNFPVNHKMFDDSQARVTLKFKDEMAGHPIMEFCGLKPKLYSIKIAQEKPKMSAKGVTRDARDELTHSRYVDTLKTGERVRLLNTRIASKQHTIQTVVVNKVSLSSYDDKRFIAADGVTTLPYGHFELMDRVFERMIELDPDWGTEELDEVLVNSPEPIVYHCHTVLQEGGGSTPDWVVPDPGLYQRAYSESELANDVVDFQTLSDLSDDDTEPIQNSYLDLEACEDVDAAEELVVVSSDNECSDEAVAIPSEPNDSDDEPLVKRRRRTAVILDEDDDYDC